MRNEADKVIERVNELEHVDLDTKEAMINKINEWRSDAHAQSNTLAVTFEKFWIELEPIFAELGWV